MFWMMFFCLLFFSSCNQKNQVEENSNSDQVLQGTRNPLLWPFEQSSIWNMPIGSEAIYVHARIEKALAQGMTIDEDIIVFTSDEPVTPIFVNDAGWNRNKSRCTIDGSWLFSAPMPDNFVVSPETWDGLTPNSGLAILMPDGRTIKQTQPFARCNIGDTATSKYMFDDQDLYGPGMYGAHGGSGLSAVGGTLRLGELRPDSGPVRHALKINLFGQKNFYYDEETKGFRWPARTADGYAKDNYGKMRTNEVVTACRMGALLALPIDWDLDTLGFETEPARILAETFQKYGAYIVDDTAWDVYAIVTEWGPKGRFSEQFEKDWGFPIKSTNKETPWARDMDRIFLNLHVVDNNGPDAPGGGGKPLEPLAPEIKINNTVN